MQYLATIYTDDQADGAPMLGEYMAFSAAAAEAGVMVGGDELAPVSAATTVRVRGDETLVTDGPFAELKETLGGYFVFECATIDEACEWAAKIPGARHGAIEVRPVHVDEEEQS